MFRTTCRNCCLIVYYHLQKLLPDFRASQEEYFTLTESEAICNCTEFAMIGAANECSDGTHPYRTAEA